LIPPTPTYAPTGVAQFTINFTLWDAAPSAISYWHWASAAGFALQIIILIAIISFALKMLLGFIKDMTRKDSEE